MEDTWDGTHAARPRGLNFVPRASCLPVPVNFFFRNGLLLLRQQHRGQSHRELGLWLRAGQGRRQSAGPVGARGKAVGEALGRRRRGEVERWPAAVGAGRGGQRKQGPNGESNRESKVLLKLL